MSLETLAFLLFSLFLLVVIAVIRQWRISRLEQRSVERLESLEAAGIPVPPTLHPVIDPTRCISSTSCTLACPQGNDVIGLVSGRGTLIDPTVCIGHGRCAAECPTEAIHLVFGTSERGVDIPHLQPTFETNVPGIYITGELGGMGLIHNAVRQAKAGMRHLGNRARAARPAADDPSDIVDVAIVGAGPAGFTSALCAVEQGLSYRFVDQEVDLGGTVFHYPRRKIVLTHPIPLPLLGSVHKPKMEKEELLALWKRAIDEYGIHLETGVKVENILSRNGSGFTLLTSQGEICARFVMLAIGRRGTPRKLGVPGEERDKVFYALREPEMHAGKRVLVVGGGDSALEAALMLAEETDAEVTLSYRRRAISRAKPENRRRFEERVAEGRIHVLWESSVVEIEPDSVTLQVKEHTKQLPNDDVLVFIGGELPTPFLERIGIRLERHFGEETEAHKYLDSVTEVFGAMKAQARAKGLQNHFHQENAPSRVFPLLLLLLGVAVTGALLWVGRDFYFATPMTRQANPALRVFEPFGMWGRTLGILSLLCMVTNFLYFIRKEFAFMKNRGNIRTWMHIHVFSGLMSGVFVLFHASLLLRNAFGLLLYLSIGIVIATGLIGRYIYAFVPRDPRGRPLTRLSLQSLIERMEREYRDLFRGLQAITPIERIFEEEHDLAASLPGLLYRLVIWWPGRYISLLRFIRNAQRELDDPKKKREFGRFSREIFKLHFQMDLLPHLKRLLGIWRSGHAILAFFLFFLVIAHVFVVYWVGFGWHF